MMKLLLPLGLLGLLGILALIIIYIIKPNYQTKHLSSTFVWGLSLKKRRRVPISRIRNLLVFLCQILILTGIGLILAQPVIFHENEADKTDVVVIVDCSASMRAEWNGQTRFERAVERARTQCNTVMGAGGYVTLILANETPQVLGSRVSMANRSRLNDEFRKIEDAIDQEKGNTDGIFDEETRAYLCSYGIANISDALELSKDVLSNNPNASVVLYTDTDYIAPGRVDVINVAEKGSADQRGEWNAAILNAEADLQDGYYTLTVDVACYGMDQLNLGLEVTVNNPNTYDATETAAPIVISTQVACSRDREKRVIFCVNRGTETDATEYVEYGTGQSFFSYSSIHIRVTADDIDSYTADDNFYLYGGQKEVVRVEYASTLPNPFVNTALETIQRALAERWDIQITEVQQGVAPAYTGFDFYVFEHFSPNEIPVDGVVFLLDPADVPITTGLSILGQKTYTQAQFLESGAASPVTDLLSASLISVTRINQMRYSSDYEVLWSCNTDPVLLVRNEGAEKLAILNFSVHYSNIVTLPEWSFLWYNLFNYFFPPTVEGNAFEVYKEIPVNARGDRVNYSGQADPLTVFPTVVIPTQPGTYTFDLVTYFGKKSQTSVFVKTPASESNIFSVEDGLDDPYGTWEFSDSYDDLILWFAAALLAFLFLEYWLQGRQAK